MKIVRFVLPLVLALATPLVAQVPAQAPDTLSVDPSDAPPPGLAAAEIARSQRCVPTLARLDTLNTKLEPLAVRSERLRRLYAAVAFEDSTRAAPRDPKDPLDDAFMKWWAADQRLAAQYATSGDSAVSARREKASEEIRARIGGTIDSLTARAQGEIRATGELQAEVFECEGVVFVRSAVREACPPALDLPLCAAARIDSVLPAYRFVSDPLELWDVESASLWSTPQRLGVAPDGSLGGAETMATERRGNLVLSLALRPVVQERAKMTPEQIGGIQADLDSLGFAYAHPQLLISPMLAFEFDIADPIAGENFYFLHFGDLSQPARDVIWSGPAPSRGPTRLLLPAKKGVLDRLAAGEIVSLTAVRFADATTKQAEALYSLELPALRQDVAVAGFLQYFTGELAQDFAALAPAAGG